MITSKADAIPVTMPIPEYKTETSFCLIKPPDLKLENVDSAPLPSFISIMDQTKIIIQTSDPKFVNAFSFKVVAEDRLSKRVDSGASFKVKF